MPGGPGWFSDIFQARFVFEEHCYTVVDDDASRIIEGIPAQIKCFDGKGSVSGKLQISPPEGRDVTHNGVEIMLKSTVLVHGATDVNGDRDVVRKRWVLLEAGTIGDTIEVSFDIDLSELKLRDTFDGQKLLLRHALCYRIVRPWYTFTVSGEEPIVIRNCPEPTEGVPPPPENTILTVDDFGGVCTLDHGKCSFSTDGRCIGTVAFSGMSASASVAEVALLLGRTEMWADSRGADATVRYHVIHSTDRAAITHDVTIPLDISLAARGSEEEGVDGPLPPSMLPLTPDDPELLATDVVSVTYWLRLLITTTPTEAGKQGGKHWSTHPIRLLPGTDAGTV
jgi:hypothetical protein